MGLDMYLKRVPKIDGLTCRQIINLDNELFDEKSREKIANKEPEIYAKVKNYIHIVYPCTGWFGITDCAARWRKANAIHHWFVSHVQNGVDDCGTYPVMPDQLENLLHLCQHLSAVLKLKKGHVVTGLQLERNNETGKLEWMPVIESGFVIANPEEAERLLPSQEGFFFGSTDYDEDYLDVVNNTAQKLKKVLAETDFNKNTIAYHASW